MNDDASYRGRRVAVLAAGSVAGDAGGAERLYTALADALRQYGCDAELITIPTDESSFDAILRAYEHCRGMDLSKYDLVISTKAPTFAVRHPRHVAYLVHTVRVFYDMFDTAFPSAGPALLEQRRQILKLDTQALGAAKHRFAIGHAVAARLRRYNGLDAEVQHPPLGLDRFHRGDAGNYFFLPGRLHPWKRVDLVIRAVRESAAPLRLLIAGAGEAEAELRSLAANDPRIEFLGRISDEALVELYANCLAVPFVPVREDYGYVTLEAFASGKPVITCTDSGEPVQFVAHGRNGWICDPTPASLREAIEACAKDARRAARMGEHGLLSIRDITWPRTVERLLRAGFEEEARADWPPRPGEGELKVAVLDMQPIVPAVGGGRLRLLGLYHALGKDVRARYVGSYDWSGERDRRQFLTPNLEEIVIPLSEEHHAAARRLSQAAGGKVVIDIAFPQLAHLSADYLGAVRGAVDWGDVLVFSHPWVYPLVADRIKQAQVVVYDSQNVEGFLRAQLLDIDNPTERDLLRGVIAAENDLGRRADLVLACSLEDKSMFERVYEWPEEKIRLVPNGVMARSIVPATGSERSNLRRSLDLPPDAAVAVFMGSSYGPNLEAARFVVDTLAPALPQVTFVIIGSVADRLGRHLPGNVRATGMVDDEAKRKWLVASDFAVNPMFSGSGTNIKMFDFMAAGLPVVTTAIGGRGIGDPEDSALLVVKQAREGFVGAVNELASDPAAREQRGRRARALVEDRFSWERISPSLGELLRRSASARRTRNQGRRRSIAVLTTWNVKCGIAEHSAYLTGALDALGWDVVILGNELPSSGPVHLGAEMSVPCVRVWHWDNRNWTASRIDVDKLRDALLRNSPDLLLIQHHTGFLGPDQYGRIVRAAEEMKLPVLLEAHNAREWARSSRAGLFRDRGAAIIVHDDEEREKLQKIESVPVVTIPLPVRTVDEHRDSGPAAAPAAGGGRPLLGGFGFLRPHKGVMRAIRILAALKPAHPEIKYVGYHASYQSAESERYLRECLDEATRLGVADSVAIDTAFRDIDEIVHCLRRTDVVLLPYENSFEGASASANVAVAAGRPIVTSSARIFNPLRDVVLMVRDDNLAEYVRVLDRLLTNKQLARDLLERTQHWAQEHSYGAAARKLTALAATLQPAR